MKQKIPILLLIFSKIIDKLIGILSWQYYRNKYYFKYRKYGLRKDKLGNKIIDMMFYLWVKNPNEQDYDFFQISDQEKELRMLIGRKYIDYYLSAGEIKEFKDPFHIYKYKFPEYPVYSEDEIKDLKAYLLSKNNSKEQDKSLPDEFEMFETWFGLIIRIWSSFLNTSSIRKHQSIFRKATLKSIDISFLMRFIILDLKYKT